MEEKTGALLPQVSGGYMFFLTAELVRHINYAQLVNFML